MRPGMIAMAALVSMVPGSRAENTQLRQLVIDALTPMDSVPSTAELDNVFVMPLEELRSIALDGSIDVGIGLRAIRALPAYCPPAPEVCGPGAIAHDTLIEIIDRLQSAPSSPQQGMRLRAAAEALGATRSGLTSDVDRLSSLLDNDGSRDLRVTVLRALRDICTTECN